MNTPMLFEAAMLLCFGLAWPIYLEHTTEVVPASVARYAERFTWAATARGTLEVLAAESLRRNPRPS